LVTGAELRQIIITHAPAIVRAAAEIGKAKSKPLTPGD